MWVSRWVSNKTHSSCLNRATAAQTAQIKTPVHTSQVCPKNQRKTVWMDSEKSMSTLTAFPNKNVMGSKERKQHLFTQVLETKWFRWKSHSLEPSATTARWCWGHHHLWQDGSSFQQTYTVAEQPAPQPSCLGSQQHGVNWALKIPNGKIPGIICNF